MTPHIVVKHQISPDDDGAIREVLRGHNRQKIGDDGASGELALLLQDEAGQTIGGLTARYAYRWMFIALLVVPEAVRGQQLGTHLMRQAEQVAVDNDLTGIWTDTFAFQAPEFYRKLGYTQFGLLSDEPGHSRYFFFKRLRPT